VNYYRVFSLKISFDTEPPEWLVSEVGAYTSDKLPTIVIRHTSDMNREMALHRALNNLRQLKRETISVIPIENGTQYLIVTKPE